MIKRLYVVDFDRTIGNTELLFERLLSVTHDKAEALKKAVAASADAFDVNRFLQQHHDTEEIEGLMAAFTASSDERYLLPGTNELFDYIKSNEADIIIMTYGMELWQKAKITASGLEDKFEVIVTSSPNKAQVILGWKQDSVYHLPAPSGVTKAYDEIILLDDKAAAFSEVAPDIIGYWVQAGEPLPLQMGTVSSNVQHVDSLYDVIEHERARVAS